MDESDKRDCPKCSGEARLVRVADDEGARPAKYFLCESCAAEIMVIERVPPAEYSRAK